MKNSVSIIFPMYNEREYIKEIIEEIRTTIDPMFNEYEIIIVDNNSNDGSYEKLAELAKRDSRIKVFCYNKARKLGNVFKTGFSKATKDIIICSDFDLPYDFSILKDLIPLLGCSDIVQGYRVGKRESMLRKVCTRAYNLLIRLIFNLKLRDVNFNMKIFKREILEDIKLVSEGPFIASEFLIKAAYSGYRIKEVSVRHYPRKYGFSKLCSLNNILYTTLDILSEMVSLYPQIKTLSRSRLIAYEGCK